MKSKIIQFVVLGFIMAAQLFISAEFLPWQQDKVYAETQNNFSQSIPENIKVNTTDTDIIVDWDDVQDSTSYEVLFGDKIHSVTVSEFVYGNLTPNTKYTVKVRAANQNGYSNWSSEVSGLTLLSTPNNLKGTAGGSYSDLSWDAVAGASAYEIYRDEVKIGTASATTYKDTGLASGSTYSYRIKAFNNAGNQSDKSSELILSTMGAITVKSSLKLTSNVEYGDLYLTGGTLDLNGYTLTVKGNLIQTGGTMYVNGGKLEVSGDYRIRKETQKADGSIEYQYSDGYLKMTNDKDYVKVNGNFITKSENSHYQYLTAGTLEIKGDFKQDGITKYDGYSYSYPYNFSTSGTHKVILSGSRVQEVYFDHPKNSCFNILEIKEEAYGISFKTPIYVGKLELTGKEKILTPLTFEYVDMRLLGDYEKAGDFTLKSGKVNLGGKRLELEGEVNIAGTIDINNGELYIKGNLIQTGGTMYVNGGKLEVSGDYRIRKETQKADGSIEYQYSDGYLKMTNDKDYVKVNGNFITKSKNSHYQYLTAGTLEIKGDFKQDGITKYDGYSYSYPYNFSTSGTHKVILSGSRVQEVYFDHPKNSCFNILEIKEEAYGISFKTPIYVGKLELTGKEKILTPLTFEYVDMRLLGDYEKAGDFTLKSGKVNLGGKRLELEGEVNIAGTIDINNGELYIKGNLIQTGGTMYVNGGKLEVSGDYRIRKETQKADGSIEYQYSDGYLKMTNDKDYVKVNGNFITKSKNSHYQYLTAGTLEIKGDFKQDGITKYDGYSYSYPYNFSTSGTHKVILSGSRVQEVYFDHPKNSCFNILEIKEEAYGISFKTPIYVGKLELTGKEKILTPLTFEYVDMRLLGDYEKAGDFTLKSGKVNLGGKRLELEGEVNIAGTIDINNGELYIKGNLIQTGGTMYVNGGKLEVSGDYRIRKETQKADGSIEYQYSDGYLKMTNDKDYVKVNGNFITKSKNSHYQYLTAGTLEIKGDFKQDGITKYDGYSYSYPYNFSTSGTHKVILSGSRVQEVYFDHPKNSCFNILEIKEEAYGISFKTPIYVGKLELTGKEKILTPLTFEYVDMRLLGDYEKAGDFTLKSGKVNLGGKRLELEGEVNIAGTIDINNGELYIKGNLIQTGGTMYVNGGKLEVSGDYRIRKETQKADGSIEYQYSDGYLKMTNDKDYVKVNGNFITKSKNSHYQYLTAGTLEIKGDFKQDGITKYDGYSYSYPYNFSTSGTHKVILSGTGIQEVYFDHPQNSRFNILEITKPLSLGYSFNKLNVWKVLIESYRYQERFGESGANPATGNYSNTFTDLKMESPGFTIELNRTYNSRNEKVSSFGRGWTFSYEASVKDAENCSDAVIVNSTDGSVRYFKKNKDGTFTGLDSHDELVKLSNGEYVLTSSQQFKYYFNTAGYLYKMQDRNGNTVSLSVDNKGKVQTITDQAGRVFRITYDGGYIKSITDEAGSRTVTYSYQNNNLVKVTDPMGYTTSYSYDSEGFLTEIRDNENKVVESLVYIHAGENKTKIDYRMDAYGNVYVYSYDNNNRKTIITDSNGVQISQTYDSSYSLTNYTDAEGKATLYEYKKDSNGINKYSEVISVTDRNGNRTQYDWDDNGNITRVINPDGTEKVMKYDEKNNLTCETDENGKSTYYVYDADKKNLIKKVQPLNGTDVYAGTEDEKFAITTYTYYTDNECQTNGYKAKGLIKEVKDPEGNTTKYEYNANGNIIKVTDPEDNTTTYEYDPVGRKVKEITPKGYITTYTYDKNDNLVKRVQHGGETTRIAYDSQGRKIKEVSPIQYDSTLDSLKDNTYTGNHGYRYTYYNNGKVKTVTDPENNTTEYTYDIYGNTIKETRPDGSIFAYEYDVMNRPVKIFFSDSKDSRAILLKEYSYAILNGGKTQKTEKTYLNDTETAVTVYTYDYAGREISRKNPDNTTVSASYNANGTLNSTTNEVGRTTQYKYDGLNRLVEQWTPFELEGSNVKYAYVKTVYDRAGKKVQTITGKDTVKMGEIPLNNIIITYEYYKNGRLKSVTDNEGRKTEYDYDADGNCTLESVLVKEHNDRTEKIVKGYVYNHLNKNIYDFLIVKTGDLEGNEFDNSSTTRSETSYTYDANGNLKTIKTADGIVTTYYYDNMNRQTGSSMPGTDEYGIPVTISTTTRYDWEGKPISTTDAKGNTTTYKYNKMGLLQSVTDALGNTTAYYYDIAGRKISEVAPKDYDPSKSLDQMNRVVYTYDNMNRLKTKTYIGEEKRISGVNNEWITKQVEIVQNAYKYDSMGNVVKELDALGYEAGSGTSIDSKINNGYGTEYTYNLANKLTKVLDPVSKDRRLSFTESYTYDALGRVTSETDAKGTVTSYLYDNSGNVTEIKVKKPSGEEYTREKNTYDLAGRLIKRIDANGNKTEFEYNAFGELRKETHPRDETIPANTIIYQYDNMGRLKTSKDTKGTVNYYIYDSQGRLIETRMGNGAQYIATTAKYDRNGNLRFETDGNGNKTEYTYDELNRLKKKKIIVSGLEQTTTFGYDANSNQTTVTDWRGNTTTNVYDSLNRLIEVKDPYNISIQKLEYNINNAQEKSYDALNNCTKYQYDKNNRLISTTDPEGHTTKQTYDNTGLIATKTDGNNNTTTYTYDEAGRLLTVKNAINETTRYTYDLNGNMLSQTDGRNNTITYYYNSMNKLAKRIDPDGNGSSEKTETYEYYSDGSLKSVKDRNGNTTNYVYDTYGRLIERSIGDITISYTYDGNGNQLTITDSTGTTVRTYDQLNRVLTKTVPGIGTVKYTYDITEGVEEGCVAESSIDPKGNITLKVYDKAGRLQKVTADGNTTTYTYYDNGSVKEVIYPDNLKETYTYYKNNLIKELINTKGQTSLDSYSYTYDAANNMTLKKDIKDGKYKQTSYTYDALNRLKTVTEQNSRQTSYTYDASGNRKTETVKFGSDTTVNTYSYNEQNRLMGIETRLNNVIIETNNYSYDNNGNLLTITRVPYSNGVAGEPKVTANNEYDLLNQLIRTESGSYVVENTYNGEGLRVVKTVNRVKTKYLYEYDKVVLELDGNNSQRGRNVYGLNLLMRSVDGESYYYIYNGHADVTGLINSKTGTVDATYYYDAFGNILESTGDVKNNITYAGYQYDKETGLYYLNARMYDPKIARFLQEDTYTGDISDPLSLNLYTYCANNPLIYYDPTGHKYVRKEVAPGYFAIVWEDSIWDKTKQVAAGIGDGTLKFISQGTYNTTDALVSDIKALMKNSSNIGGGIQDYFSQVASDTQKNVIRASKDVQFAWKKRNLVAETVSENMNMFAKDVRYAVDNRQLFIETTGEMVLVTVNDFNKKGLREKTAIITDVSLNVASFIGVPEAAAAKVVQLQKVDRLLDAANLVNKIDDLYDAGMGMKRLDQFIDASRMADNVSSNLSIVQRTKNYINEIKDYTVKKVVYDNTGGIKLSRAGVGGTPELGKLKSIGNGQWESTEGLIYGQGSIHGNRVKHVLDHAAPNPNKPVHSVYNVPKDKVLSVVDEAWSKRSNVTPVVQGNGNAVYDIPMGRIIGTNGETTVRVVVKNGTSEVITAYPK